MDLKKIASKKIASRNIAQRNLNLRMQLWPDITDEVLWNRKQRKGFTTIPRGISSIIQIMNDLATGKPLGSTYLALWCHTYDESLVIIGNPRLMAFEAGFSGQRAESTWKQRMQLLVNFGFIQAKEGASGLFNFVVIINPYLTIKALYEDKKLFGADKYNALVQRAIDIGADDLF